MTRKCTNCEKLKPLSEFHSYKTGKRAGTYRTVCISCIRKQNANWYLANKDRVIQKTEDQKRRKKEINKRWRNNHRAEIAQYKKERRQQNWDQEYRLRKERAKEILKRIRLLKSEPCMDCGRKFPYFVMDFDHRDPNEKLFAIGNNRGGTRSWDSIEKEIAKCDLVCSNCHRIRTAKSLGWRIDENTIF